MSSLQAEIAHLDELHVIVNIFGPEILVLVQGNVKPRLHVPVVVNDRSVVDFVHADAGIVTKTKHMPRFVQRLGRRVEGDQSRRESSRVPQHHVIILITNFVKLKRTLLHCRVGMLKNQNTSDAFLCLFIFYFFFYFQFSSKKENTFYMLTKFCQ